MTDNSKWINYAGEICTSKNGNSKYIRIKKDFKALKGNTIQLKKFDEYLDGLVESKFITEEQKKERLEKVTWVTYVLTVPPQEFKESDNSKPTTSGWTNNALELRKSKAGGLYLKITKDFEAVDGHSIPLKKYQDHLDGLLQKDFISEEEYEERLKTGEWLYYIASIPPKPEN